MVKRKSFIDATRRYRAWRSLLDLSTRLAIAGLRKQGFSPAQAWAIFRQRWIRSIQEHQQTNRRVVQRLMAQRGRAHRRAA